MIKKRFTHGLIVLTALLSTGVGPIARGGSLEQARRERHFEVLKARGVFVAMDKQGGVPRLVVSPRRARTEPESFKVFVRIVYEYFKEADPTVTRMLVIDSVSGRQIAWVDASGYQEGQ
jgi:hypothetical protein